MTSAQTGDRGARVVIDSEPCRRPVCGWVTCVSGHGDSALLTVTGRRGRGAEVTRLW